MNKFSLGQADRQYLVHPVSNSVRGGGDVMAELDDTGSTSTSIEPFHIKRFVAAGEFA